MAPSFITRWRAAFHPFTPPPERDTRGEYWTFFSPLPHSLFLWGRNLIRGKYHQTWRTPWLPRRPPVVRCLGSSQGDRCKLILCLVLLAAPILFCQHGCTASWGTLTAHTEGAGDSTPDHRVTDLTPPSDLPYRCVAKIHTFPPASYLQSNMIRFSFN